MSSLDSPLARGGWVSLLLAPPVFGVCAAATYGIDTERTIRDVSYAIVATILLYVPAGPLVFGLGSLTAELSRRLATSRRGPASSSLRSAGIGALLMTTAASLFRLFGSYVTDGAYARAENLQKAPTLWVLIASLAAGAAMGAWIGHMLVEKPGPEDWGRSGIILLLLLMAASVIYFAVWESRTLYVLPSTF